MSTPLTLEEMEARIKGMTPKQLDELEANLRAAGVLDKCWLPQIGPQTDAYYSLADETLYGGAAGGGKSDLLLGLASTAHLRSVIFRRQSVDLDTIWNRLLEVVVGRIVKSDANKHRLRTTDNRLIEFGHLEKPGSEKSWQGNAHDLYGFDEAAQLDEFKVAFVIQWLRSTTPGQRKRVVFATNPPIPEYRDGKIIDTGTGAWLKEWFAPWLEDSFPNPAKPGELRYCFMETAGDRMTTIWVDGPGGYDPVTHERIENYTQDMVNKGKVAVAISRTFIKSLLKDNIYLRDSGYAAKLSTTPEPLKSLLLTGSFTVKSEDHPFQVIPTLWVLEAQERWRQRTAKGEHKGLKQLVLFGDIAQGGADTTVLASLLQTDYYEEPKTQPGRATPTGEEVAAMVLSNRRDRSLVGLDGTGGWGGATRVVLMKDHEIEPEMLIASAASHGWTADMLYKFLNLRAEDWWTFREALDPKSGYEICLPPSTRLMTQLTAPIFIIKGKTIQIESKEDLRKRLGSSTDEADAVIGAWHFRSQALAAFARFDVDIVARLVAGKTVPQMRREMQRQAALPVDFDDPLQEYR